ncbi:MAG: hypothetical protein ABL904_09680, partial [Hyphomicrobiaceae bacterium]
PGLGKGRLRKAGQRRPEPCRAAAMPHGLRRIVNLKCALVFWAEISGSELKIMDKTPRNTLNKTRTYDTLFSIGEVKPATQFVTRLEA